MIKIGSIAPSAICAVFLPRDAAQNAAMPQQAYVFRLPVRPAVCLWRSGTVIT